jgi:hypothetical protein
MTAAETDAAREWLERFIGIYAARDEGEGELVHAVRAHAREMLAVGPTPDDPFTICREIADALPADQPAASLCDTWSGELERATTSVKTSRLLATRKTRAGVSVEHHLLPRSRRRGAGALRLGGGSRSTTRSLEALAESGTAQAARAIAGDLCGFRGSKDRRPQRRMPVVSVKQ